MPSLRERKRYLAYKITSSKDIKDSRLVSKLIKASCLRFMGELGISKAGIIVMEDKFKHNMGLIKVGHTYIDEVRASLALIKEKNMVFSSIGVSGILKKAERYLG